MSRPPAAAPLVAFHSPIIDSDDLESTTPPDAEEEDAAMAAAAAEPARRSIAAPVPIRRSVHAPPVVDSRSLSPIADQSAPVSHSVPASQLHRGPLSLSSHNLLDSLGREGGDELFSDFFNGQPTAHHTHQHGQPHAAMHPSQSSGQLQHQQQPQPQHQYTRAQGIPIHATSHSLAHHSTHPQQLQPRDHSAHSRGPSGGHPSFRGSPSSTSPPTSVAASLAGIGGTSYVAQFAGAGAGGASAAHDPMAPPRHPPPSVRLPPTFPAMPPGRSWSLIEHGKRYLTDPSSGSDSATSMLQPVEEQRRRSLVATPSGRGSFSSTAAAGTPLGASDVVASSWSGGGVTHISLPVNLASANAEARTRGRSHSSASSALTAHVQAVAAATPPVTPARLLQSSALVPSATKSSLTKLEEYVRELGRVVEEYKQLLVRLGSRKRQVLGTLSASMSRLSSWMQVGKLEVLQELMTLQDEVFLKEETMLQKACIILKERAATLSGEQEEILEQLVHLVGVLQAEIDKAGKKGKLSKEHKALQASFASYPPKSLMDSIAISPKQFAQSHALLRPHSDEHRALTARLEACKARYLAVARATDLEELVDRKTRMQRVVAALEHKCTEHARRNAPPIPPAAAAPAAATAAPAPVSPDLSVSPSQLDYSPARDIELEYAKLVLDERTKEGRAVAKFVGELEAAVSAKDAATPSSSTGATPPNEINTTAAGSAGATQSARAVVPVPPDAATAAAAANPAAALAAVSSSCYDSLGSFLSRLEASIVRDYAVPPTQKPYVRLLNQRTIFPRIWPLLLALGYEEEDLRCLPPLPAPTTKDTGTAVAPSADSSQLTLPSASSSDMSARELQLQSQLDWLRQVSPAELGIPPTFLKPTAKPFPSVASPKPFVSAAAAASPTAKGGAAMPATPTNRAPPSYKPTLPPVSSFASRSYTSVIELLEELGQLSAPSDMVGCLMAASKAIYKVARGYVEQHVALVKAASAHGGGGKVPKSEALGADSFFPLFLYVLVQSSVRHWLHRLKVMQRFALDESSAMAEPAYYLTTLEAALIFVAQATPQNINPNNPQAIEEEEGRRRRKSSEATPSTPSKPVAAETTLSAPGDAPPSTATTTTDDATVDSATLKLASVQLEKEDLSVSDHDVEPSKPAPLSSTSFVAIPAATTAASSPSVATVVSFSAPVSAPVASTNASSSLVRDDAADTTASSPALSSSSPASVSHAATCMSPSPTPHSNDATQPTAAATVTEPRVIPAPLLIPASPAQKSSSSSAQRSPAPVAAAHPHDSIASSHPLFSASNKHAPESPFTRTFDANDL